MNLGFTISLYQWHSSTGTVSVFHKKFHQFYWSKNNYQIGLLVFSYVVMLLVPPSNTPLYFVFCLPSRSGSSAGNHYSFCVPLCSVSGHDYQIKSCFKTGDVLSFLGVQSLRWNFLLKTLIAHLVLDHRTLLWTLVNPSGPKRGKLDGQLVVFKEELYLMGLYCVDDISDNGILFVIKLLHFAFLNRSDADSNKVYVYDGQGTNTHLHVFEKLHTRPVVIIKVYEQFCRRVYK